MTRRRVEGSTRSGSLRARGGGGTSTSPARGVTKGHPSGVSCKSPLRTMNRSSVSRTVAYVRRLDEGRMVPRTAVAERIAAVAGAGGVVVVAAEAGTGKRVLAQQAL